MSNCPLTFLGLTTGCKTNVAGVKSAYIISADDMVSVSAPFGVVLDFNALQPFRKYEFNKGTASLVTTANTNDVNDTLFYTTNLNLKFTKINTQNRNEIEQLIKGNLKIVVELNDGTFKFLGYNRDVNIVNVVVQSSTNMGDFIGYELTFLDLSNKEPYFFVMGNLNKIYFESRVINNFNVSAGGGFTITQTALNGAKSWFRQTINGVNTNTNADNLTLGTAAQTLQVGSHPDIQIYVANSWTRVEGVAHFKNLYELAEINFTNGGGGITEIIIDECGALETLDLGFCDGLVTVEIIGYTSLLTVRTDYSTVTAAQVKKIIDHLWSNGYYSGTLDISYSSASLDGELDSISPIGRYSNLNTLISTYGWTYINNI